MSEYGWPRVVEAKKGWFEWSFSFWYSWSMNEVERGEMGYECGVTTVPILTGN